MNGLRIVKPCQRYFNLKIKGQLAKVPNREEKLAEIAVHLNNNN
jgi:hypothetical protein